MKKSIIHILLTFLILPCLAHAEDVNYFINQAVTHSPVLKASKHKFLSSKASYKKEHSLRENPTINFGYSNIPVDEWPARNKHAMSGISIGISQFIDAPWEMIYRNKKMYFKYLSESDAYSEARNMLILQVRNTYHTLMFLYEKEKILKENRISLENILRVAEALVSVDKMNSANLLKIRANLYNIDNAILELQGTTEKAQALMDKLCGISTDWTNYNRPIETWQNLSLIPDIPDSFDYHNTPLYKKLNNTLKAQKSAYDLQKAMTIPGVKFGFDYRIREEIPGKDSGEDFVSLTASIPIPLYYPLKDHNAIKAEGEKWKELKETVVDLKNSLKTQWRGEYTNYKKLYQAYKNHRGKVKSIYWASYEAHIAAFPSGTVSLIDVLDSYRQYLTISLEGARLFKDLSISTNTLLYLSYKDLPEKDGTVKGDPKNEKKNK